VIRPLSKEKPIVQYLWGGAGGGKRERPISEKVRKQKETMLSEGGGEQGKLGSITVGRKKKTVNGRLRGRLNTSVSIKPRKKRTSPQRRGGEKKGRKACATLTKNQKLNGGKVFHGKGKSTPSTKRRGTTGRGKPTFAKKDKR